MDLPPHAVALAQKARLGRLVIYAGAGLSAAEPTRLPSAAGVARTLHQRLSQLFPSIERIPASDLTAVADAVAKLPNGEDALRETAAQVAEFTTAIPSYGHELLAYLLLEGIVDVLTTNWDTCIERGCERERLSTVVSQHDLLDLSGKSLLKVHGCATKPSSLLLTTADLSAPPRWVLDETRARLGNSTVVFIGIGSVASYVRLRIEEAVQDVSGIANVRVVSRRIDEEWEKSGWAQIVPNLSHDHRYAESADAFLERLAAAFLMLMLIDTETALSGDEILADRFKMSSKALKKYDPLTLLRWFRHAAVVPHSGSSVVTAPNTVKGLTALGTLAGEDFAIGPRGVVSSPNGSFEMIVAVDIQTKTRMRREAQDRLDRHRSLGEVAPTFVLAGEVGSPSSGSAGLLPDVIGLGDPLDIVGGPGNVSPTIKWAEEVLSA